MILIVALDNRNGMMYNGRRQSQDRELRRRILEKSKQSVLWVSPYTRRQFVEPAPQIRVSQQPMQDAGKGEYCFMEDLPVQDIKGIEEIIIYRWNRSYPFDKKFQLTLGKWRKFSEKAFQGYSHGKITEEVYRW